MGNRTLKDKASELMSRTVEIMCLIECLSYVPLDSDTDTRGRLSLNGALEGVARLAEKAHNEAFDLSLNIDKLFEAEKEKRGGQAPGKER